MKVNIIGNSKETKSLDVNAEIFGRTANQKLISQVVQWQLANKRNQIAHTKTRGEVSGGGKKPFKQKGTGRARAGSSRSPIWVGGGIVFGPRNVRNFSQRLPQKMNQRAIMMAMSQKMKDNKFVVVKSLKLTEIGTKKIQNFLEKLPLEDGKILAILGYTEINFELSCANLPYMKVIQVNNLNLFDLLKYDYILTDVESIKKIEELFTSKENEDLTSAKKLEVKKPKVGSKK